MKNIKPIHILLGGSSIIMVLTLIITLIIDVQILNFPMWVIFGLPLLTAVISFGVFYFFIKYFINDRLKFIYRSIRKGKITKNNEVRFSFTEDVIAKTEQEAKNWVEERNQEIEKLKGQEEFRRDFLGNLAHELKTPIFSIQGYILTLLEGGLEDENVNRLFLERASKATDRMVSLIEDLDQITKLEADALHLEIRSFDIHILVKEIFESLETMSNDKGIKLVFAKEYSKILVKGDRTKIAQVLTNLIVNSIFYGSNDGETSVRFYNVDDIVSIEVSDNGPGISPEQLPRLFERFYRVEKSRNRNDGGSGLGLAIVKHIIESHDQTVNVRSTLGLGSTFSFTLEKAEVNSPGLFSTK